MENKKLKVAISLISPFVIESNGRYSGFEIELWEMIAKEMNVSFEYEKHNFQELIPLIQEKKADIGFASITVNEKREELVDFSHPIFNSGLRILLSKNRKNIDFASTIRSFLTQGYKQFIKPLLVLLAIIFILGSTLFFIERNNGSISTTYFPGAFQATWIYLCSMLGLDGGFFVYTVSSWIGRVIVATGQIVSIAFLGLFIGELTAFITTKKIRMNIEDPKDLRGKTVATVKQTTSEMVLKELGATVIPVPKIENAYEKLKKNQVEAVVFDAPALIYYTINDGSKWAEVVGELFDEQNYGFILQEGSALRKDVNLAILTIRENGSYDALYKKWFGEI